MQVIGKKKLSFPKHNFSLLKKVSSVSPIISSLSKYYSKPEKKQQDNLFSKYPTASNDVQ